MVKKSDWNMADFEKIYFEWSEHLEKMEDTKLIMLALSLLLQDNPGYLSSSLVAIMQNRVGSPEE